VVVVRVVLPLVAVALAVVEMEPLTQPLVVEPLIRVAAGAERMIIVAAFLATEAQES
jgi:hypothetical protein